MSKTMYIVGSKSVAEEIVQDVFTQVWTQNMVFENLRNAYAWIYRCCTNAAIDHLRGKANQSDVLDDLPIASGDMGQMDILSSKQVFKDLVKKLDDRELEVFIYRNLEGLTQDEVVEVMGISRRTVVRIQESLERKLESVRKSHAG